MVLGTILFVFLANRDITKIYGGHTKEVEYEHFDLSGSTIVIHSINVLSADGNQFIPNQTVKIDKGVIVSIDSIPVTQGDFKIINGEGKFLIP